MISRGQDVDDIELIIDVNLDDVWREIKKIVIINIGIFNSSIIINVRD